MLRWHRWDRRKLNWRWANFLDVKQLSLKFGTEMSRLLDNYLSFLIVIWNNIVQAGQQRLRVAIETLEKQSKELDGMIDGYSVGYFFISLIFEYKFVFNAILLKVTICEHCLLFTVITMICFSQRRVNWTRLLRMFQQEMNRVSMKPSMQALLSLVYCFSFSTLVYYFP